MTSSKNQTKATIITFHCLKIKFVLEGVEDSTEVAFARSLGIEYFQGYYYGKPALPAA
ncbi:EAL domain-containing protein [Lacticaseibacillus manihotivorans]|uniref:EAL domain-containing protein n=1 Tax=Lacticaseibacillus manihotivorans TaxID=88233 RepID=UPI0009E92926